MFRSRADRMVAIEDCGRRVDILKVARTHCIQDTQIEAMQLYTQERRARRMRSRRMTCVSSASASLCINGYCSDTVVASRGINSSRTSRLIHRSGLGQLFRTAWPSHLGLDIKIHPKKKKTTTTTTMAIESDGIGSSDNSELEHDNTNPQSERLFLMFAV